MMPARSLFVFTAFAPFELRPLASPRPADRLPSFVLALGQHVEWGDEELCFQGLAQASAVSLLSIISTMLRGCHGVVLGSMNRKLKLI